MSTSFIFVKILVQCDLFFFRSMEESHKDFERHEGHMIKYRIVIFELLPQMQFNKNVLNII